ncbi:MAG: hypothetical protein KatS3mg077_1039 [Candidatus Binatia bacterium]|nr:MAG: hypothetical protein KatS3mg077_1039 [Candidatus Binatia bacterium]
MAFEPQRRPNNIRNTGLGGPANYGGNAGWSGNGGWEGTASDQVRDILHVLFKHKRLIAALFLVVALPGLLSTVLQRPKYLATAKVMISASRTDPTVQPTDVTKLEPVQLNESLVNTEVHIVTSRDLLSSVVQSLSVNGDGGATAAKATRGLADQLANLQRTLAVTPIKASNVIQIDYRHSDPAYAARVVNRLVDEYLAYHAEVHGNKDLPRFYDEQRKVLEQELRRAEQALIEFSNKEGVVSPADEIAATVRMVAETASVLREINASIVGTEERLRVLREQIAQQPEVVKRSQSLEVNPVITQLTSQLVDRQVDRVALLRKYTEKDRHVRDNDEEIQELRAALEAELRERPTVVSHQLYRTNPLREDRLRTLLDLESQVSEMRARQAALEDELSRSTRRLILLRQKGVEFERLEQEVKTRREAYELYVKREQEARISRAMDEQKLVNVSVVQRPTPPLPQIDTRRVSASLALLAGLVVGIAGAFAREYVSRPLRSESDVVRFLGLPLLGTVRDSGTA